MGQRGISLLNVRRLAHSEDILLFARFAIMIRLLMYEIVDTATRKTNWKVFVNRLPTFGGCLNFDDCLFLVFQKNVSYTDGLRLKKKRHFVKFPFPSGFRRVNSFPVMHSDKQVFHQYYEQRADEMKI